MSVRHTSGRAVALLAALASCGALAPVALGQTPPPAPPPPPAPQPPPAGQVTVCRATGTDQFQRSVVPAEYRGPVGPGDVVLEGAVPCPSAAPVSNRPDPLPDAPVCQAPGCKKEPVPGGGAGFTGKGEPSLTPVSSARETRTLPDTGSSVGLLALILCVTLACSLGGLAATRWLRRS